jgi:lysophospholipase L1-like esterase
MLLMRRRFLVMMLLGVLLAGGGWRMARHEWTALTARHASLVMTPAMAARSRVIVAIGDSITYGLHDDQQPGGWVARLAGRLHQDYPGAAFDVRNAGVNGDTAAGVLGRLSTDVLAVHPGLMILSIGTNDFDYGVPAASFRATLTQIIDRAQAAGISVLAASMLPSAGLLPSRLAAESAYNAMIPQVCAATGAGYLDEFDQWLALGSAELTRLRVDAEHPNAIGYRLMADDVAAYLETQYLTASGRLTSPSVRPSSDLLPDDGLARSRAQSP